MPRTAIGCNLYALARRLHFLAEMKWNSRLNLSPRNKFLVMSNFAFLVGLLCTAILIPMSVFHNEVAQLYLPRSRQDVQCFSRAWEKKRGVFLNLSRLFTFGKVFNSSFHLESVHRTVGEMYRREMDTWLNTEPKGKSPRYIEKNPSFFSLRRGGKHLRLASWGLQFLSRK